MSPLPEDLGKLLETVPADLIDDVQSVWPKALAKVSSWSVKHENLVGPDFCLLKSAVDVAGYGTTDANGVTEISVGDNRCRDRERRSDDYSSPVNVQVTGRGRNPVVFAVTTRVTGDATQGITEDLILTVRGWDLQGNPAGGEHFYWRCLTVRKEADPIVD